MSSLQLPLLETQPPSPPQHQAGRKISFPCLDPVVLHVWCLASCFQDSKTPRSDHPRRRSAPSPHETREDHGLTPTAHNKGLVWCVLLRLSVRPQGAVDPSPASARVAFRAGPSYRSECRAVSSGKGRRKGLLAHRSACKARIAVVPCLSSQPSFHRITKSRWVHITSTLATANSEL